MVTYAYTDKTGRNITKSAYDAQVKSGTDVSGYVKIWTTETPVISNPTNIQNSPAVSNVIPTQSTTPVVSSPAGLTDEIKNTSLYKSLISKWHTEADIATRVSAYQAKQPVKEETTQPVKQEPIDAIKQWTQGWYNWLQWTTELITPQDTAWRKVELYRWNPDYQDASEQRLLEISNNVKSYYNTNPNAFNSYEDFKNFFHYWERVDEQKQVLDTFWRNKSTTDMFWSMSASEIWDLYLGWTFTDSDLSSLWNIDPNRLIEIRSYINEYNTYNNANSSVSWEKNGVDNTLMGWIPQPPTEPNLIDKYNELVWTDEINTLQNNVSESKLKIEQLDEKIFNMKDSIKSQYSWTGINSDILDAIVADKTEALNKQKRTETLTYNSQLEQYNWKLWNAKQAYESYKDQATQNQLEFKNKLDVYNTQRWQTYQLAQLKLQEQQLEAWKFAAVSDWFWWITIYNTKTWEVSWNTNTNVSSSSTSSTSYTDAWWQYINIPRNTNWYKDNVGVDTNNFWNITSAVAWNIGMYKSPNWRTYAVFATAKDWYNALVNDLKAKQSGNTKTWLNWDSTVSDLLWVWVNGKKWSIASWYLNTALKASWLSANSKIWSVDVNKLATAIMAWEWTLNMYNKWWIDLSSFKTSWPRVTNTNYTAAQMDFMKNYDPNDKNDYAMLWKVYWLTPDDVAAYKAQKLISNTDFADALSTLSPSARDIVMWNRSLADSWIRDRWALQKELSDAWISEFWLWNQDYWMLKDTEKDKLRNYLQLESRINLIHEMLDKWTSTWFFKNLSENTRNILSSMWIWWIDLNFNELKTAAWKSLVEFMKNISWVAISEQEANKLSALIPDARKMSTTKFKNSLKLFENEYKSILDSKINDYWFDSLDWLTAQMWMSLYSKPTTNTDIKSYTSLLKKLNNLK